MIREEQESEVTAPMTFSVIADDREFATDGVGGDGSLRLDEQEDAAGVEVITVPSNRRARPGEARAWFEDYLSRFAAGEFTEDLCAVAVRGPTARDIQQSPSTVFQSR